MKAAAPVVRHPAGRTRRGLVVGVAGGLGESWAVIDLLGGEAVEPVLARLEALDELVPGLAIVRRRVLRR